MLITLVIAALPFLFNERTGVLGEGIYTNDQAAQLFWTDWLQEGFGPEPKAVQVGYPTGPQSVVAATAEATGASLVDAFNGLLLAIPALTALAALAGLRGLAPVPRVVASVLTGLPYLAASYLAQSAFKETVMALLVLAFVVALGELGRDGPRRPLVAALALFAAAAVLTYSIPGLVWFGIAIVLWLALEAVLGRGRPAVAEVRDSLARHRGALVVGGVLVLGLVALTAGQISNFFDRLGDVQGSSGRLSSPVFPGEALGVWPEGDFQIVRGDVDLAIPATLIGFAAAAFGALAALRRRDLALLSMLAAAAIVYVAARLFASIYVDAKSLAIAAPLVAFAALGALLAPGSRIRLALGAAFALLLAGSTFLALRSAPVGFDERGIELESLAKRAEGEPLVFLGVDRFAGYWLRDTLVESPGGYVPPEVRARPQKDWQQGRAMDLDTLAPSHLDDFDYAITTTAAYASTPLSNMERIAKTESYILWRRTGPTPPNQVLRERGSPGASFNCESTAGARLAGRDGVATVLLPPVVSPPVGWSEISPFEAPATASQELALYPGRWLLSLQYQSQVPLTVSAGGASVELPPSLDGMYLTHQGQGAFWAAGEVRVRGDEPITVSVTAADPSDLQDALGVERRVWLGKLAAIRARGDGAAHEEIPLSQACGRYVDHYRLHDRGDR